MHGFGTNYTGADPSIPGRSGPVRGVGLVATLTISMGIGPLLIYALSAVSPRVIADLNLTHVQFGSFATVAFLVSAMSSGVFGRIADRRSERAAMFLLYLGGAAALLFAAVSPSYVFLLGAVVLAGLVQAMALPLTNRLVVAHTQPSRRGLLSGVKQSGVQAAQFTAGMAMPVTAVLVGWRGALVMAITITGGGLLLAWRCVPRRSGYTEPRDPGGTPGRLPRSVWWLAAYALVSGIALQACNVYLPLYGYEQVRLSITAAGFVAAVVGGIGLAARIVWGRVIDHLTSPRIPLLILPLLGILAMTCIHLAGSVQRASLLWLGAAIFGATAMATNVVVMVTVMRVAPSPVVGHASGILATGLFVGFAAGPLVFGGLVDATASYGVAWLAAIVAYAVAAGLGLIGRFGTLRMASP